MASYSSPQAAIAANSGTNLDTNNPARVQQDTFAAVDTVAPTVSGGDGSYTYAWTLEAPDGTDQTALYSGTTTNADPGGWTPSWTTGGSGVYKEQCVVTDGGGDTSVYVRLVQVGDAAGWVLQDLSAATEIDSAGVKGAGTVLGPNNTLEAANQHGTYEDNGMDGAAWITLLGTYATLVASYRTVQVRVSTDKPASGPSTGRCQIVPIVSTGNIVGGKLVAQEGYAGSGMFQNNVNNLNAHTGVNRIGGFQAGQIALTGRATCVLTCPLGDTKPTWVGMQTNGAASGEGGGANAVDPVGTWTDLWAGVGIGQSGNPPGAAVTFDNVKCWVRLA